MANPEHVARLIRSTAAKDWNKWREENPDEVPDLSGLNFENVLSESPCLWESGRLVLRGYDLRRSDLRGANFGFTRFDHGDIEGSDARCAWFGPFAYVERDSKSVRRGCDGLCPEVLRPDSSHAKVLLGGVTKWNDWRKDNPKVTPDLSGMTIQKAFVKAGIVYGEEGVDLSGIDFGGASLRGADFWNTTIDDGNLLVADLRCAIFEGMSAKRVNLRGTDLRRSALLMSNFNACDMRSAKTERIQIEVVKFGKAKMPLVDFRGLNLDSCDFEKADLKHSKVDKAVLKEANLVGADLVGAAIWKARLFDDDGSGIQIALNDVLPRQVRDLQTLIRCIDVLTSGLREQTPPRATGLYFRGVDDYTFPLEPTVMRKSELRENEDRLMSDLSIRRPDDFEGDALYFQRLVIARHFELPTRLLDVTRDPLIALYYAAAENKAQRSGVLHVFCVPDAMIRPFDSDTVSLVANFGRLNRREKDILLTFPAASGSDPRNPGTKGGNFGGGYHRALTRLSHFIAQEKPYWEPRINPEDFFKVLFVEPQQRFARLRAHSGAFIMSAYHETFERNEVRQVAGAAPYAHFRIGIPHNAKDRIRGQLAALGVDGERLKSDLESSAKAVAETYGSEG